ncbi:MAG: WG repeat-containing protein [Bacteroidota bacterium]
MKSLYHIGLFTLVIFQVNAQKLTKVSQYHLSDANGKRITPLFSSLEDFDDAGNAIFSVGGNAVSWGPIKGAKYGIINTHGSIVLPASYDYLDKFAYNNDSLYKFGKGESLGLLNMTGKELIPAMYKYISKVYYSNSMVSAEMANDYTRLFSFDGKPLTPIYQRLRENEHNYHFKINGYEGYMDHSFKEIIKPEYVKCEELKNGTFLVQDKTLKAYILSKKGTPIHETKYDEIDVEYGSDYETIQGYTITKSGKEGFCDPNFKVVLEPAFRRINRITFGCDNYIFSTEKDRNECYLYGQTGKLLTKTKFKYIDYSLVYDKYIVAELKPKEKKNKKDDEWDFYSETSKYTLLNLQGKAVLNQTFEDYRTPSRYSNETLLLLKIKGAWIAYNEQLEPVLEHPNNSKEKFTYMESLGENLYSVQIGGIDEGYGKPEGGVFGIYNELGVEIFPMKYEDVEMSG